MKTEHDLLPPPKKNNVGRRILFIVLLVLGWLALLAATDQGVTSAVQLIGIGLGLLICARMAQNERSWA